MTTSPGVTVSRRAPSVVMNRCRANDSRTRRSKSGSGASPRTPNGYTTVSLKYNSPPAYSGVRSHRRCACMIISRAVATDSDASSGSANDPWCSSDFVRVPSASRTHPSHDSMRSPARPRWSSAVSASSYRMTTSCFDRERAASSSGRTARWAEDMRAISPGRAMTRQSSVGIALRRPQCVAARQRHGHEDDDHHEERLDETDARNPVRRAECCALIPADRASPANERHHRPDLEQEDDHEESHLQVEERIAQIVVDALFRGCEQPGETRPQPQHGGDAPPRVGSECPPKGRIVNDTSQRTTPRPYGAETNAQREQMCGGKQEAQHAVALVRVRTAGMSRATIQPVGRACNAGALVADRRPCCHVQNNRHSSAPRQE